MKRRTFLNAAASVATLPLASAWAQQFPSRTVTLLVPYAAGGNADFTARLFAEALSRTLGQSVVVDNKAGGGGAIGATHVVNAKPDGHTLLYCAPSVFSVTPHLVKVSYGISDIRPVCLVTKTPMIIVARKNGRYRSLADLVEAAKKAPGAVQMGYSGLGTPNHLAMLNLEAVAGVRFTGIPYKGSGPMLNDMLAGQIDVAPDQYTTSKPYIESGDLIPIAVFGPPLPQLPSVPSVSTLGTEPFDVTTYLGVAAPRATPDAIIRTLQQATEAASKDARFLAGIEKMSSTVAWAGGDEYERLMRSEDAFMRQMIAQGRVKPES